MRPRLTIITPSFNQAAFLERTLRSVLDQGYENLEYLVVDGGSTDGSVDIIRRYEDRLAWWVSEPDKGQTDALNKALRRATGDVIAYINSDDVYLPGAFDRAVAALRAAPDADWVVGACRFEGDAGFTTEVWRPELPRGGRHWWILGPWGVPQPSSFWRRSVFDDLGLFREDLRYVFDTEHGLRLVMAGRLPVMLDDELAVRVLHDEAKSAGDDAGWAAERGRLVELFGPSLTARERRMLAVQRALIRGGFYRLTAAVHPLTGPVRRTLARALPRSSP
jgi:glycosyltransferase involved in cell wall biosynthesis